MRYQFFTIPVHAGEMEIEALNIFLSGNRIVEIDRQFVSDGTNSAWSFCIGFSVAGQRPSSMRRGKVDYKEVLNEPDFAKFARLRQLRKQLADQEGVPAYAIFTNEQLSEMVKRKVVNATALREIPGVGEGRVEKYGSNFLELLAMISSNTKSGT